MGWSVNTIGFNDFNGKNHGFLYIFLQNKSNDNRGLDCTDTVHL